MVHKVPRRDVLHLVNCSSVSCLSCVMIDFRGDGLMSEYYIGGMTLLVNKQGLSNKTNRKCLLSCHRGFISLQLIKWTCI